MAQPDPSTEIVHLSNLRDGRAALARARDLGEIREIKRIADIASAAKRFAEAQGMSEDAKHYAAELTLDAKRCLGEVLAKQPKAQPGPAADPAKPHSRSVPMENRSAVVVSAPTLEELGITKKQSSQAQQLASIPEKDYEDFKENGTSETLTTRRALRLVRDKKRKETVEASGTVAGTYRVFYADPPWQYGSKGLDEYGPAERHYSTLSTPELCALKVNDKTIPALAQDSAVLFLWATSPLLPDGLAVMKSWGFAYKSSFIWDKVKHNYGHYNSVRHELLLIGTKGSCLPDIPKLHDSVISIERDNKHSSKPSHFRDLIDELYPNGKRLELFAREKPKGWDTWGSE